MLVNMCRVIRRYLRIGKVCSLYALLGFFLFTTVARLMYRTSTTPTSTIPTSTIPTQSSRKNTTERLRDAHVIVHDSVEYHLQLMYPELQNTDNNVLYKLPCYSTMRNGLERSLLAQKAWKKERMYRKFADMTRNRTERAILTRKADLEKMLVPQMPPTIPEYVCWLIDTCKTEIFWTRHASELASLCPCIPEGIGAKIDINLVALSNTSWQELLTRNPDVQNGGHWAPSGCVARRRVAVIVPVRDRERHLRMFLAHIHPVLQKQLIEYRIFVVEQNLPYLFNKAALMNIGFLEATKSFNPDCVLFHDVDTLTERYDNMVACGHQPIHWGGYSNKFNYALRPELFGSAVLMKTDVFRAVNGFTNLFYGWGAEDDNLNFRFIQKAIDIYRGPMNITRCTILEHARDTLFRLNQRDTYEKNKLFYEMEEDRIWQQLDGVNSTHYDVIELRRFPAHTWIQVDLKPPVISTLLPGTRFPPPDRYRDSVKQVHQRVFHRNPNPYTVTKATCSPRDLNTTRHYLSRVTCRYMCEVEQRCKLFEYFANPSDDLDSYCIFYTLKCRIVDSDSVEIHKRM